MYRVAIFMSKLHYIYPKCNIYVQNCDMYIQIRLVLEIHRGKSKVNTVTDTPIMLEGEALDEVESFTYLGSIVGNTVGTEADVRMSIFKATAALQHLKNVWKSSFSAPALKSGS